MPGLEQSFDTGFQLPWTKKPCDCLHTPGIASLLIFWPARTAPENITFRNQEIPPGINRNWAKFAILSEFVSICLHISLKLNSEKNENLCKNCNPTASSLKELFTNPSTISGPAMLRFLTQQQTIIFLGFQAPTWALGKQASSPECCWSERE